MRIPVCLLLLTGITFFSCTNDLHKPQIAPCNSVVPDTVSFQANLLPLFRTNCALGGCHSGSSPQSNFSLDDSVAYAQLMKPGKGYINTGNPPFSVVYLKMTSTVTPMPPTGLLDSCQIMLVLKWIEQGAKNN